LYIAINAEVNYYIDDRYSEVTGYKTVSAQTGVTSDGTPVYPVDEKGKPLLTTVTPITETKNHRGNYLNIKPMISIGFQF
jgi:hypothetical protein